MHPYRLKTRGSTLSHILVDIVPSEKDDSVVDICEVLSSVVEKIKEDKELSVYQLLNHPGSEHILNRFLDLLGSLSEVIRSQSLLVVASICSFDVGRRRFTLLLLKNTHDTDDSSQSVFLDHITAFLSDDSNNAMVVKDAAATLCTLASSLEGRRWLLSKDNFHLTIFEVCRLISAEDNELKLTVSLLIARITVDEEGCARILNCRNPKKILVQIIAGLDAAEPSEQIAVALGQVMKTDVGRVHIMMSKRFNQMVTKLIEMVSDDENESCWAACFALGSLTKNHQGLSKVFTTSEAKAFVESLFKILWKGKLTETSRHVTRLLTILVSSKEGWDLIKTVDPYGKQTKMIANSYIEDQLLFGEVNIIIAYLKSLPKPEKPVVKVLTATSVHLEWKPLTLKCDLPISYALQLNDVILQCGSSCSYSINDLSPYTNYTVAVKQMTDRDESQYSDLLSFKTKESVPSAPRCFKVVGTTTSQLKLSWLIPEYPNGIINGYVINCQGKNSFIETAENHHIFSNLAPETTYTYEVCAFTSAGRGRAALLSTKTASLSDFAPTNVSATIVGRSEILLQWDAPVQPLGRINYYEVTMNDKVIYSGIDRKCRLRQIKAGTEPMFTVAVWTSEGKCEAKPIFKKLPKTFANVSPSHKTLPHSKAHKRVKRGNNNSIANDKSHKTKNHLSNHLFVSPRTSYKSPKINTMMHSDVSKPLTMPASKNFRDDFNISKLQISKQVPQTAKLSRQSKSINNKSVRPQAQTRHSFPLPAVSTRPTERPQVKPKLSIQNITLENCKQEKVIH